MKKIQISSLSKTFLADVHTPVGIYLRLRDRFRDTVLLESTDSRAAENSYSFIGINAIAGIEVRRTSIESKYPGLPPQKEKLEGTTSLATLLWNFCQSFEATGAPDTRFAQGLYGYTSFDASYQIHSAAPVPNYDEAIPLARYRLYQYVIAINHFKDELLFIENKIEGVQSEADLVQSLILSRNVPLFPFMARGEEETSIEDSQFLQMVEMGIKSCYRGDVFQIVLSKSFSQKFTGDEFNVYRALRHVNPSPYLFYFDYGDYKLMGSSPEAQLVIRKGKAIVHPIAGTFKRTGDDEKDNESALRLLDDKKENAEHIMLVDLARNDLGTVCTEVNVSRLKEVQKFSHVIHLVSEVEGSLPENANPFQVLYGTFPAGTLSGAPKHRALQLIEEYEQSPRGYYGGTVGFTGFDGSTNHAIMIRSLISRNNTLQFTAGAGIVASSNPQSELEEVYHKSGAVRKAIALATELNTTP